MMGLSLVSGTPARSGVEKESIELEEDAGGGVTEPLLAQEGLGLVWKLSGMGTPPMQARKSVGGYFCRVSMGKR